MSQWDNVEAGDVDEAYPEVYTTIRQQPDELKPGQLSRNQVETFYDQGYLVIEHFFDIATELDPCRDAVEEMVDNLATKLLQAGKIKNLYSECGLFQRLTMIENEFPGASLVLIKMGTIPQAFRNLWSNERLLNLIEQLIGPDISGHPIWNLRPKTPNDKGMEVPWHQDNAYMDNDSYKVLCPTAWIPLLDANEENGCLQVVRGGHRLGKICHHDVYTSMYVKLEEEEMERTLGVKVKEDAVICPVPYGGLVLFTNMTPHRSLPNISNNIRWSLDLRWLETGKPNGFYGMQDSIPMRSSSNADMEINWDAFDKKDIKAHVQEQSGDAQPDEFDPTVKGPWNQKWRKREGRK